jgi:hypothetical protein
VAFDGDSGREDRSDERPQLATVRRLHLDDDDGSTAIATEEWYETERLTGHITGGVRHATAADPPAPTLDRAPPGLDWRHAPAEPAPTVRERLTRAVAEHRDHRRGRGERSDVAPEARGIRRALLATVSRARTPQPQQTQTDETSAARETGTAAPLEPRLGFRRAPTDWTAEPVRRWSSREGRARVACPRWRNAVIATALMLSLLAVAGVSIVARTGNNPDPSHSARAVVEAAGLAPGLSSTTKAMIGSLGVLEHRVRTLRPAHRTVHARRHPRHTVRHRARHTGVRQSVSRSVSPPASTVSTPSTASAGASSSSPPAYNQPTTTTTPATVSTAPSQPAAVTTTSAPLPPGPAGPGGTVGSNCNPKCK